MKYGLWAAALLLAQPALAGSLPPDLAKAAHDYDQAQMHNDAKALNRLVALDYTLVNSRGEVSGKADFIRDSTAPGFHIDPFTVQQPVEKVWEDGAVLGGVVDFAGTSDGKPFHAVLRFADVWAKRHGTWQVIYTQVAKAK
jgi:hypothetical protein